MEVINKKITLVNKEKDMEIIPMGCVHLGTTGSDLKKFKETIEYIRNNENAYTILMGDLCDAIMPNGDKRFDVDTISPNLINRLGDLAFAQYEEMRDLLLPIKDKILCGIRGNHGETLRLKYNVDFDAWLYKELGIQMGGYTSFLVIKFDREQFHTENVTIFLHHGFMGGRRTGSKVNATEDLANSFLADIYLMGHAHSLFSTSRNRIIVSGNGIKEKTMHFAQTGTFLRTYTRGVMNYGEKACYPPSTVGTIQIYINPRGMHGVKISCMERK